MRRGTAALAMAMVAATASVVAASPGAGAQDDPCIASEDERALGEATPTAMVATGPGAAVAVGTDALNYPRAIVWVITEAQFPGQVCDQPALAKRNVRLAMSDVAVSDDGTLVAIGTADEREAWWRSTDGGYTWTMKRFPASLFDEKSPEGRSLDAVAWTGKEFLAAGLDGYTQPLGLWSSRDGRKWSRVAGSDAARTSPGDGYEVTGFYPGTAVGIAVNDAGAVVIAAKYGVPGANRRVLFLTRPAGSKSWKQVKAPAPDGEPEQFASALTSPGEGFVVVGFEGSGDTSDRKYTVVLTSVDGTTWERVDGRLNAGGMDVSGVALSASPQAGVLAALNFSAEEGTTDSPLPQLWRSVDGGATWSEVPDGLIGEDIDVTALAAGDGPPVFFYAGGSIFAQHSDDVIDDTFGFADALFLTGTL